MLGGYLRKPGFADGESDAKEDRMDERILDASSFIVFVLWIATAAALIANLASSARRVELFRAKGRGHDFER